MLARITAAIAATILLAGSALASGSTVSTLHNQQTATVQHNMYAAHSNNAGQRNTTSYPRYGYNDAPGSHELGAGPG
jgi:hypothetical protein